MTAGSSAAAAPARPVARSVILVLGALSAFGPLSLDLYLPALPDLSDDLGVSSVTGQLTMTACMIGLALGQLTVGPLSDRFGRRKPLLLGVAIYALASLLCASTPTASALIALRLVQGVAGGAGIVIARAIVRDLFDTEAAARIFSLLAMVTGIAPVLAPVLGGQLMHVTSWRGLFVTLSLIGCALLIAALSAIEESHPNRSGGGLRTVLANFAHVGRDPRFVGFTLVVGFASGLLFTYITMSSYVLQDDYGLSSQAFSLVFALNACGMVATAGVSSALVTRIGPARTLRLGLSVGVGASFVLAVAGIADLPLPVLLVPLFFAVSSIALVMPNATALGLESHGARAGAAAGVMGLVQFGIGGSLGPAISTLSTSMVTMSMAMLASCVLGLLVLFAISRGTRRRQEPASVVEPAEATDTR
ncbi:multidrug effflux MFS transporter [Nocardia farcinica]|uniref:multidrug effflux MFS transporter n=1 Tax=Nocardia farcinica TaxID=37329 RepID=UPI002456D5F3|nr:multidrug effflux MFS transporter [Nocardia farcinica]